jgi:hypothetical protein
MADRIASDAPTVETHRAHLTRSGGTRLPALDVPAEASLSGGEQIRLVLDGHQYHARVERGAAGPVIRGAYDTASDLRIVDGEDGHVSPGDLTNRLVEWSRTVGREPDDAVDFDEIDPGYHYGVRVPGERAVYELLQRPDSGLQDIARNLDG